MATVQKSTVRRYNGVDWDTIYFGAAADITVLGTAAQVEEDNVGFSFSDVLEFNDTVSDLLIKIINRLTTLDIKHIAALERGEGIASIDASKINGVIDRKNLPEDVGGKCVEVATEAVKDSLTPDDVNVGDIVKVTDGGVYIVTATQPDGSVTYAELDNESGEVEWDRIINAPTTIDGYGITDGVKTSDLANKGGVGAENKVAQATADGKLDFDILGDAATLGTHAPEYFATQTDLDDTIVDVATNAEDIAQLQTDIKNIDASWVNKGTLPLSVIPKAAVAEMHIVTNYEDIANLTAEQVQMGDTIKVADKKDAEGNVTEVGGMYYVTDETKLGTDDWKDGIVQYTAGTASSVDWSGVLNTPTDLAGYGITDAVNVDDLANRGGATAVNKVAQANAEGKLDFDITGDAATLGGNAPEYYATQDGLDKLTKEHSETAKTLKELVEMITGESSGNIEPDPGEDPTSPAYVGPIRDAAVGDTVTWADLEWLVTSKNADAQTAELTLKTVAETVKFGSSAEYAGSDLQATLTSFLGGLSQDCQDRLTGDKAYVATYAQMNGGLTYFSTDANRIALNGEGTATEYWTSSPTGNGNIWVVEADGTITDDVTNLISDIKGFRPSVTVNLEKIETPSEDTFMDPVRNAAVGDVITWDNKEWLVYAKNVDSKTASLMLNATYGTATAANRLSSAANMAMSAAAKAMVSKGPTTALASEVDNTGYFSSDAARIARDSSGTATAWWLADTRTTTGISQEGSNVDSIGYYYVDETGVIKRNQKVDASTYTAGVRPVVTVTVPDKTEKPKSLVDRVEALETIVGSTTTEGTILYEIEQLKAGDTVKEIAAEKITGELTREQLPDDISGRIVEVADLDAMLALTTDDVSKGDLVKIADGRVYGVKDTTKLSSVDGYVVLVDIAEADVDWSQIVNTPTTLAGYGITDAVNVDDVIEDGIVSDTNPLANVVGKLVKIAADGKLHVDIAGDAATLEGHSADYFATSERVETLALNVPVWVEKEEDFVDPSLGQLIMIPVGDPVNPDDVVPAVKPTATASTVTEPIWGKAMSDLQDIAVSADGLTVTGTSKYVSWPEFSSDPADQEGNFIVLKIDPTPADAVVKVKSKNGDAEGYKTLDDDHILVWKMTAGKNIEILINTTAKTIDISGVTMEPKATEPDPEPPVETVSVTVSTEFTEPLLGQDFSAQNLTVADGKITGNALYIENFTDFSSDPEEQSGYYICLKIDGENPTDVIKVKSKNGDADGYKTLDEDHILIWRMTTGKNIELLINDKAVTLDLSGVITD